MIMSKTRYILSVCVLAAFALASCTQDELAEQGTALPEGKYPITFSAVQVAEAEPQTRVSENADGTGSVWTEGDKMEIHFNEEFGDFENFDITLTVDANGNVITQSPQLYWPNTGNYTYDGMYSNIAGESTTGNTVSFGDQSQGLAYVLLTSGSANCHSGNITLTFHHALNKVRVKLEGEKADDVASVSVKNYTSVNIFSTFVQGGTEGYIKMHKVTSGDETYWEANVAAVAGTYPAQIQDFRLFRSDGTYVDCKLNAPIDPNSIEGGKMFTVTINVKSAVVPDDAQDITTATGDINDSGNYVVNGSLGQTINITGGNPHIYLDEATVSVSDGHAISVTGNANATIHVVGDNNMINAGSSFDGYAGIYVTGGSSVTITGNGGGDQLTVIGGGSGAAIGGYFDPLTNTTYSCGDITINNLTLYAYANFNFGGWSPGIGASGNGVSGASYGSIKITSALVYARSYGNDYTGAPAIGAFSGVPNITITDSEIHAQRGGSQDIAVGDYIGRGGDTPFDEYPGGAIQCGSGSITSSTIYCETYDWSKESVTSDKTVTYDESGVGTEQQ